MVKNAPLSAIYAAQIRAARGLLYWSQGELAERAGVSKQSVTRPAIGTTDPRFPTMTAWNEAQRSSCVEMANVDNRPRWMTRVESSEACDVFKGQLLGCRDGDRGQTPTCRQGPGQQ